MNTFRWCTYSTAWNILKAIRGVKRAKYLVKRLSRILKFTTNSYALKIIRHVCSSKRWVVTTSPIYIVIGAPAMERFRAVRQRLCYRIANFSFSKLLVNAAVYKVREIRCSRIFTRFHESSSHHILMYCISHEKIAWIKEGKGDKSRTGKNPHRFIKPFVRTISGQKGRWALTKLNKCVDLYESRKISLPVGCLQAGHRARCFAEF